MPTYDYQCQACSHRFEASQKITDSALSQCPACKEESLVRGIGGGSAIFRFVGDGFYVNDKKECHKDAQSCCPCKNSEQSKSNQ